jgi:chromosome partitioning protein
VFRLQSPDVFLVGMPKLATEFEHLVVDGQAGLSEVTRAILLVADLAWLPCGPSVLDLRAANDAIRVLKQAQAIRHGPPQAVLVPNKLQVQYRLSRKLLATAQSLEIPSAGGLRLRQAYADAAGQGTVVWRLGTRGAAAAHEIRETFDGLLGQESQKPEPGVANG